MSSVSPIQIILQRRSEKDDVVSIWPREEEGFFDVVYEDKDSKAKYAFADSWDNVVAYLAQIFAVLSIDRQPFQGVQFTLPAYPAILLEVREVTDESKMQPVWSMIESVACGWPATLKKPSWKA